MRAGRGGGFGGGRSGGGFSGGRSGGTRSSGGRIGSSSGSSSGRAGRGLGGVGRAPRPTTTRPTVAPRTSTSRNQPSFGTGLGLGIATGLGLGQLGGGGRRRNSGFLGGGFGGGGGNMGRGSASGGRNGCGGCGCGSIIAVIVMLIVLLTIISSCQGIFSATPNSSFMTLSVTPSTVNRTPLPRNSASEHVPMFTDHLGWIRNQSQLLPGMRSFHDRTGVRPHLYILGDINGNINPTLTQLSTFANARYDELFDDEAHLLFVFFENINGDYMMYVVAGNQARSVIDNEAREILLDMVQRYYYTNMSEEELFSRAFDQAGRRMMEITRPAWIPVAVVVGILLILALAFMWWKRKKEQDRLEAEETERILGQSLHTFGSSNDEASRLAQKYDEK